MKRFNEKLAVLLTKGVGSMTCAYLFFLWALLPLLLPQMETVVAYVSQSIIQLVLLSVIMVGQAIDSRRTERLIQETHDNVMTEMAEIKQMHSELHTALQKMTHKDS